MENAYITKIIREICKKSIDLETAEREIGCFLLEEEIYLSNVGVQMKNDILCRYFN